jgi:hypothetical protein
MSKREPGFNDYSIENPLSNIVEKTGTKHVRTEYGPAKIAHRGNKWHIEVANDAQFILRIEGSNLGSALRSNCNSMGLADLVAWGHYPSRNLVFSEHFGFRPIIVAEYPFSCHQLRQLTTAGEKGKPELVV